jgi:hypothetical protein
MCRTIDPPFPLEIIEKNLDFIQIPHKAPHIEIMLGAVRLLRRWCGFSIF